MQNFECFKLFHYARAPSKAKQSKNNARRNKGSGWPICANTVMIAPKQSQTPAICIRILKIEENKNIWRKERYRECDGGKRALAVAVFHVRLGDKWPFHLQYRWLIPRQQSSVYRKLILANFGCFVRLHVMPFHYHVELLSIDLFHYYFIWTIFLQFLSFQPFAIVCHCVSVAVSSSEQIIFHQYCHPFIKVLSFRMLPKKWWQRQRPSRRL